MSDSAAGRRSRPAPRLAAALAVVCFGGTLAGTGFAAPSETTVGPGPAHAVIVHSGYRVELAIGPNLGGRIASTFRLGVTRAGHPVAAKVTARFTMEAMPMPSLTLALPGAGPGIYEGSGEKLTMPGRWRIGFLVAPRDDRPFQVTVTDIATVQ
jgi:YtkA-like protein